MRILPLGLMGLFCWTGALFADYTLLLKNGRRITVGSYREEGGMIKFSGFGGEISIAREQIESIMQAGEGERPGMVLPGPERAPGEAVVGPEEKKLAAPAPARKVKEKRAEPVRTEEEGLTPEERLRQERAKEEGEYQKRVREITQRIKALRDRYSLATRGSTGPEPGLLDSEEAIRARTADLNSRLKDRLYNPAGPSDAGGVRLSTPSPFAGSPAKSREIRPGGVIPRVNVPLPAYSEKEKELSRLRNQINQLQKERERLIQEMRQKNFNTGSLFLQ